MTPTLLYTIVVGGVGAALIITGLTLIHTALGG